MAELKPCPFCGGEAQRLENRTFGHYVSCTKCRARTDYYASSGVAVRVWNRRAGE
ncbi:MAG: Lar family restriction alleviation protein [Bacteroidaceae bacterium]|nr:Lar family restriction alleviation protein [Bacteroidaceae bacterium]MBR4930427.1 Lar family restriction alleviation protein [Bacteroidaceae bacterium]